MSDRVVKYLLAFSVISACMIIFLSTMFSFVYNLKYYDNKYQKYGIYEKFSRETAIDATENLFGFFRGSEELGDFYGAAEKSHLEDVRVLIGKARALNILCQVIFWLSLMTVYIFYRKQFVSYFINVMRFSGVLTVLLIFLFLLLYFTAGFDFLFSGFHKVFFTGNYSFDPRVSNMKALFPDEFFSDISMAIIIVTAIKALLMASAGYYLRKRNFKFKNNMRA